MSKSNTIIIEVKGGVVNAVYYDGREIETPKVELLDWDEGETPNNMSLSLRTETLPVIF
jgi:hypothetical protein